MTESRHKEAIAHLRDIAAEFHAAAENVQKKKIPLSSYTKDSRVAVFNSCADDAARVADALEKNKNQQAGFSIATLIENIRHNGEIVRKSANGLFGFWKADDKRDAALYKKQHDKALLAAGLM